MLLLLIFYNYNLNNTFLITDLAIFNHFARFKKNEFQPCNSLINEISYFKQFEFRNIFFLNVNCKMGWQNS